MSSGSNGQRLVAKVVNRLGGVRKASAELGIHESTLMQFIDGTLPVPDGVLLKIVDYVLEELPTAVPGHSIPPKSKVNKGP